MSYELKESQAKFTNMWSLLQNNHNLYYKNYTEDKQELYHNYKQQQTENYLIIDQINQKIVELQEEKKETQNKIYQRVDRLYNSNLLKELELEIESLKLARETKREEIKNGKQDLHNQTINQTQNNITQFQQNSHINNDYSQHFLLTHDPLNRSQSDTSFLKQNTINNNINNTSFSQQQQKQLQQNSSLKSYQNYEHWLKDQHLRNKQIFGNRPDYSEESIYKNSEQYLFEKKFPSNNMLYDLRLQQLDQQKENLQQNQYKVQDTDLLLKIIEINEISNQIQPTDLSLHYQILKKSEIFQTQNTINDIINRQNENDSEIDYKSQSDYSEKLNKFNKKGQIDLILDKTLPLKNQFQDSFKTNTYQYQEILPFKHLIDSLNLQDIWCLAFQIFYKGDLIGWTIQPLFNATGKPLIGKFHIPFYIPDQQMENIFQFQLYKLDNIKIKILIENEYLQQTDLNSLNPIEFKYPEFHLEQKPVDDNYQFPENYTLPKYFSAEKWKKNHKYIKQSDTDFENFINEIDPPKIPQQNPNINNNNNQNNNYNATSPRNQQYSQNNYNNKYNNNNNQFSNNNLYNDEQQYNNESYQYSQQDSRHSSHIDKDIQQDKNFQRKVLENQDRYNYKNTEMNIKLTRIENLQILQNQEENSQNNENNNLHEAEELKIRLQIVHYTKNSAKILCDKEGALLQKIEIIEKDNEDFTSNNEITFNIDPDFIKTNLNFRQLRELFLKIQILDEENIEILSFDENIFTDQNNIHILEGKDLQIVQNQELEEDIPLFLDIDWNFKQNTPLSVKLMFLYNYKFLYDYLSIEVKLIEKKQKKEQIILDSEGNQCIFKSELLESEKTQTNTEENSQSQSQTQSQSQSQNLNQTQSQISDSKKSFNQTQQSQSDDLNRTQQLSQMSQQLQNSQNSKQYSQQSKNLSQKSQKSAKRKPKKFQKYKIKNLNSDDSTFYFDQLALFYIDWDIVNENYMLQFNIYNEENNRIYNHIMPIFNENLELKDGMFDEILQKDQQDLILYGKLNTKGYGNKFKNKGVEVKVHNISIENDELNFLKEHEIDNSVLDVKLFKDNLQMQDSQEISIENKIKYSVQEFNKEQSCTIQTEVFYIKKTNRNSLKNIFFDVEFQFKKESQKQSQRGSIKSSNESYKVTDQSNLEEEKEELNCGSFQINLFNRTKFNFGTNTYTLEKEIFDEKIMINFEIELALIQIEKTQPSLSHNNNKNNNNEIIEEEQENYNSEDDENIQDNISTD